MSDDTTVVRRSRVISADPAAIFDLLADPAKHPAIDGSGSVKKPRGDAQRLTLGARFGMDMRIGLPYRITNEVVEFEEGRRIGWRHFGGHIWRWILEPVEGGTKVTEEFDYGPSRSPVGVRLAGFPQRNAKSMEASLERLEQVMGAASGG